MKKPGKIYPDISPFEQVKGFECARFLSKIYEIHTFVCTKCSSEEQVITIIMDTINIRTILRYLVEIGMSPPGLNYPARNKLILLHHY